MPSPSTDLSRYNIYSDTTITSTCTYSILLVQETHTTKAVLLCTTHFLVKFWHNGWLVRHSVQPVQWCGGSSGCQAIACSSVVEHCQVRPGVLDWIPRDCWLFLFLLFSSHDHNVKCLYFWLRQEFVTKAEGLRTRLTHLLWWIQGWPRVYSHS